MKKAMARSKETDGMVIRIFVDDSQESKKVVRLLEKTDYHILAHKISSVLYPEMQFRREVFFGFKDIKNAIKPNGK